MPKILTDFFFSLKSENTYKHFLDWWNLFWRVGLGGFNVGLSYASGLLPTVWDSSRRMTRRHVIAIFIRPGGGGSSALIPPEVQFGWELGRHYTHDGIYMHQVPLACMAVFARWASNPGPPVRSWGLYLGQLRPLLFWRSDEQKHTWSDTYMITS